MSAFFNIIQFIMLGAVWGGSFLFLRIISPVLGPVVVTDTRVLLGTLMIGSYMLLQRKKIFGVHPWFKIAILAFLSCALPFTLIAFTEIYLTTSMGSILNATTPIYAALLSLIVLREKSHYSQYLGFLLGIVGVIILVGFESIKITPMMLLALAAILLATLCYASGGLYAAKAFSGFPPVLLAFWQQLFSFLLLLPFAVYQRPHVMPNLSILACMLCLGVMCTGLAFLLYFNLIKNIGPHKTMSVAYIIPIFGMLWGHLFLGEDIGPTTILGAFTILFAVYLIYRKPTRSTGSVTLLQREEGVPTSLHKQLR